MLEILKMNNINLNQTKSKFILTYEKGIRLYETKSLEKDSISYSIH